MQAPNVIAQRGHKQVGQNVSGALFRRVLQHLKLHSKCNKENKILLLLGNHESHCAINAINFC